MCTGIDPTGGCLGPDFDPYTGKYLDEIEEEEEVEEVVVQRENLLAKAPYSTDPKDLHQMSKFARNGPQYLFFEYTTLIITSPTVRPSLFSVRPRLLRRCVRSEQTMSRPT